MYAIFVLSNRKDETHFLKIQSTVDMEINLQFYIKVKILELVTVKKTVIKCL